MLDSEGAGSETPRPVLDVSIESLRGAHVAIATPNYGNQFTSQYLVSMLKTNAHFARLGLPITVLLTQGASVERVRNQLVAEFLDDTNLTHLLFIDSDQGWESDSIIRLLAMGHDVIGVPIRKKTDEDHWNFNVLSKTDSLVVERGAFEIKSIGTGFLMISRSALLRMCSEYKDMKVTDDEAIKSDNLYTLFSRSLANGKDISEDLSFCNRWRAIGGRIWADPDSSIVHVGQKEWSGKFAECITHAPDNAEKQGASR